MGAANIFDGENHLSRARNLRTSSRQCFAQAKRDTATVEKREALMLAREFQP